MNSQMRKFHKIKCLLIGSNLVCLVSSLYAGQSSKEVMTPPTDSTDRENLLIWVPVQHRSQCRLTIDIMDAQGQTVRHLVNTLAPQGYFKFYWNKRDDSGNFVEPATYSYLVNDCGTKKSGLIKAVYKKWERLSTVTIEKDSSGFTLKLLGDSARVSVEWYSMNDSLMEKLYTNEILMKGDHHFSWTGELTGGTLLLLSDLPAGRYLQKVTVGDFVHVNTIRFDK